MNKINSLSAPVVYSSASTFDRGPARRLIVLFPASASDDPAITHRIWEMASSTGLDVLFISLCNEYNEEAQLRRKLVTMAAVVRDRVVSTEIMIESGRDWVAMAKSAWRQGDVLACYGWHKVGLRRRSLYEALRSSLDATVYVLADELPMSPTRSKVLAQTLAWVGSIVIIAGFLLAEVQIVRLPQDWTHSLLLYLCLFMEVGLIWGWNSIFM